MQLSLTPHGRSLLTESSFSDSLRLLPNASLRDLLGEEMEKVDQLEALASEIIDNTARISPLRDAAWQALSFCRDVRNEYYETYELSEGLSAAPLVLPLMLYGERFFYQDIDLQIPLGKAVTAAILDSRSTYDPHYSWTSGNKSNHFSLSIHGDLTVQQLSAPLPDKNPTLFERQPLPATTFDEQVHSKSFTIFQDASTFLLAILDYARRLERSDLHEIVNWKAVEKEVKPVSTNTAEAFGGTLDSLAAICLRTVTLLDSSSQRELSPIVMSTQRAETSVIAAFIDERLFFLASNPKGSITIDSPWCARAPRFSEIMSFDEKDLPQLMRGTLKLFARDRSCMSWLLGEFAGGGLFLSHEAALPLDRQ